MVSLIKELENTTADTFAEDSKAFITQLAATPQKAAEVSLVAATAERELESLRKAARAQNFTLSKIRNTPVVVSEDGLTQTMQLKLGPLVEVPQGVPRPNRKKADDAAATPAEVSAP